jgi:predicted aspartyl protease
MTRAPITGVCYALLACGTLAAAPAADARPGVAVQLRVFPHAAVDSPTLERTRETVTALLASAGVRLEWRDCPMADPSCGGEAPAGAIIVRLLPSRLTGGHVFGKTAYHLDRGATVLVFVPRAFDLAQTVRLSPVGRSNPALATLEVGHVLGLTMAHEVGHALGLRHAASGVMKARFAIEDIVALRASRLTFTRGEGASMRQAFSAGPAEVVTPFESRRPGEVIVPVTVGSRGPFRFVLDTGSTHSAVTERLANAFGARPVARTTMQANGGTIECPVVSLPPLAVGDAAVEGLTVTALPPSSTSALGHGVDGILGNDFLSRFRFTIDYRRSWIVWHGTEYVPQGVRLRLIPSQDRWLVELPQPDQQPTHRFVPDSGADTLVLYGEAVANRIVSQWRPEHAVLGSLTGDRVVRTATVDRLRVGGASLERQRAVIAPASAADGVDGLLPLYPFASVYFNVEERYLVVQPRQPAW